MKTTRQHPFYVDGKGWLPAGGLATGNAIVTRAGPRLLVKSVKWHRRAQGYVVYNFEVEALSSKDADGKNTHSYFVGKTSGGAWVHNGKYNLGQGPVQHFTDAAGASGIAGVNAAEMAVGESIAVDALKFGKGANSFMAGADDDIFVTELGAGATIGQLNGIGVFGARQNFAIQFSRESAFANGIRISPSNPARSIFTIPGGSKLVTIDGINFSVMRVR